MGKEDFRNIRLGSFIIVGTALLVMALYLIGNKQNLFGSTFKISAKFYNVNGLMRGNNVRFGGIDVGTVESVEIVNDSSVNVVMIIEKKIQQYIKKNAVASVGTDGLMGNKLVNINAGKESASVVEEGDVIKGVGPVEMDEMVRTLNITNENVRVITTNLRTVTDRMNNKNSLWNLLMDTVVAENVKSSVVNLKLTSNQAVSITGNLKGITNGVLSGKGTFGALIMDTILSSKIKQTVVKFEKLSDTAAVITGNISYIVNRLKQGQGSIGILLKDTTVVQNLNKSIKNIENGAGSFNENMEALKHAWPFKKYYRKQKQSNLKN